MNGLKAWAGKLNRTNILSYTLFLLSVLIALATAYFLYNIDVIKDWRIVLPNQAIHAGDTVVVESRYTKLIDVRGVAKRYIDCESREGVSLSYPLNEAIADRKAGKVTGTGVEIAIPTNIPNTPTFCKIRLAITYKVLPLREVIEVMSSPEFELLPPRSSERSSDESQATTQTTQSQELRQSGDVSLPNNAPVPQQSQSNTSPPVTEPDEPAPSEPATQRVCTVDIDILGLPIELNCREEEI